MPDNWNLVSNGGVVAATLAIADEPGVYELANEVFQLSLGSMMDHGLTSWGPDGVWPEGPGYWGFGTFCVAQRSAAGLWSLRHTDGLLTVAASLQLSNLW